MDPIIPVSWQLPQQTPQAPQYGFTSPATTDYSYLLTGPDLTRVVAQNDETRVFAQKYPAIDHIQHILACGQYLEYLFYGDQFKIKGDLSKCCQESITFLNDQYNAIQIDYPILTAYDCKIRDLELELINESQETSITSLAAAHQSFDKIYRIKGSVLTMMKSRSALLHQDVFIREQLLQIDTKINKYVPVMMQLQLCVKVHIMNGMEHEPITRKHLHDAVTNLLPWTNLREQKRAELQRCRADRAAMEKRLKNVKAELNHS